MDNFKEIEKVPIRSYYKSTLVKLYANEGEVKWDLKKLRKEMQKNSLLICELNNLGYKQSNQSLTAEQVALVFKYLSHPILTDENKKLLKL